MSDKKLKWGILGAARVNQRLLPAIMEAPNSQLVAIASRRAGAAKEALEKYASVPNYANVTCYDDLESLIVDDNIEAVYCPMANEEHAEWAMRAINAGKHVLIEKPMTTSLVDMLKLECAAKENNVTVMEGFMYRFHPQHNKLHDMINQGLIGDVLSARASFSFLMKPARMYRINRSMAFMLYAGAFKKVDCPQTRKRLLHMLSSTHMVRMSSRVVCWTLGKMQKGVRALVILILVSSGVAKRSMRSLAIKVGLSATTLGLIARMCLSSVGKPKMAKVVKKSYQ